MATVTEQDETTLTLGQTVDGDTISKRYLIDYGSNTNDVSAVLTAAQTATGTQLPLRNAAYAVGVSLYATSINLQKNPINRNYWDATVTWSSPDGGSNVSVELHPLFRPPQYSVDYIEKEIVIEQARNLEPLATGTEAERAANTWGPIVNGAAQETEEALLDSVWHGVLTVRRYAPSLDFLIGLNQQYQGTTNSDTVLGTFNPRTLKYQVTQSSEQQVQDDIPYYEIQTQIEILPTTDRKVQSTGLKAYNLVGELENAKDSKNRSVGEPVFIGLDGQQTPAETFITYRYLTEKAYSVLVT